MEINLHWEEIVQPFSPLIMELIKIEKEFAPEEINKSYHTRYEIPNGLTKKELRSLQKEANEETKKWLQMWRNSNSSITREFCELVRQDWETKSNKLKQLLSFNTEVKDNKQSIEKAKQYPIENLVKFNSYGFAKCIFHGPEKTASMKFNKKSNRIHCFSCSADEDAIGVYMKINSVDFNTAVKSLSI
tara:strand:- start:210 stop:773 length:564 start_codon:yes stop_codon:yes gene_type:complete